MTILEMRKPAAGKANGLCNSDQLGGEIGMKVIPPELQAQVVHDGSRVIGYVCERASGQVEAAPVKGRSLGLFNSPLAAVHALIVARADG